MSDADHNPDDEPPIEPSDELLAGEYVLGVLDAEQRRAVQARIAAEPPFAALVTGWEAQLAPLTAEIGPQPVPAHVWLRIRQRLGWPATEPLRSAGPWHSVGFWRTVAALSAAAAIALVVIRTPTPPTTPEPVFALAAPNGATGWVAIADPLRGTLLVVPVPNAANAAGRVPELWLLPPGRSPQALALLTTDRSSTVVVPSSLRGQLVSGALLAVSLEPPGGAPHGVPTGPIVAEGRVRL